MFFELPSRKTAIDSSMIPLINVVFLMLAFFMIAGHIQRSGPVQVTPPESISETSQAEFSVVLHVSASGSTFLDSDPIRLEDLTPTLMTRISNDTDIANFRVLVKADGTLPAEELRTVLKHLRATGLLKVSLATLQSRDVTTSFR